MKARFSYSTPNLAKQFPDKHLAPKVCLTRIMLGSVKSGYFNGETWSSCVFGIFQHVIKVMQVVIPNLIHQTLLQCMAVLEFFFFNSLIIVYRKIIASAGNRTRVTRVAGENSTTEPPMLTLLITSSGFTYFKSLLHVNIYIRTCMLFVSLQVLFWLSPL